MTISGRYYEIGIDIIYSQVDISCSFETSNIYICKIKAPPNLKMCTFLKYPPNCKKIPPKFFLNIPPKFYGFSILF